MSNKPKNLVGLLPSSGASGLLWIVFFFLSSLIIGLLGIGHRRKQESPVLSFRTVHRPPSAAPHSALSGNTNSSPALHSAR